MRQPSAVVGIVLLSVACASGRASTTQGSTAPATSQRDTTSGMGPQYPSTYQRHPNPPVLIRNATIMTATGEEIRGGSILIRDGRIVAVGATVDQAGDATVVDGTGKWVTPGIIDVHSHLCVYAAPG